MYVFQGASAQGTMMVIVLFLITTICGFSRATSLCATYKKDTGNGSTTHAGEADPSINRIHFRIPKDDDLKSEECNNFCFALWKEEKTSNGSGISILLQGCWKQSGEQKCENTECIAGEQSTKALNNTKFCCCTGDYCNLNIKDYTSNKSAHSSPTIPTQYLRHSNSDRWILIIVITLISSIFLILTIAMLVYKIHQHNLMMRLGKPRPYTDQFTESALLKSGAYTVDHLKLSMIVGQGKYGSVWQANMGDQDVAVKIYPSHYATYFKNERDTYCLPFMEHPSLLHYFGANERVSLDGSIEYLLVLSYAPGGTLTDFLRCHTIDWPSFCKMGLTIVKGLAHLHTDICKGDSVKPCIAHRDINSRNILIKADGTCCVCDLGLSVQLTGSKYYTNGEDQRCENKSVNDQFSKQVGTLRYMAPEILEGAVNLRDCESSLKQIDVYAIGLVLWELVSRCTDIYLPGTEIPPYAQPFEREIGVHPTFEQMQVHVSRNKVRPALQGNVAEKPHVRLICETMEDCWDADAEARLTALCIEERLTELQSQQVTAYSTDDSYKLYTNEDCLPSLDTCISIKAPNHDSAVSVESSNLVHLSRTSMDDQSSTSSNEKPVYKVSGSLESINSTQLSSFEQSQSNTEPCTRSTVSTSKQSLEDRYPAGPEYRTLENVDSPVHKVATVVTQSKNSTEHTNHTQVLKDSPRKRKFAGWSHIKNILLSKKPYSYNLCEIERDDSKSSLLSNPTVNAKVVDTVAYCDEKTKPSEDKNERPSTLPISSTNSTSTKSLSRQESLDKFNEIFNVDPSLRNLKDPHMRIKTPGDLPPSVRKMRGRSQSTARFSLYDDRIMCNIFSEEDDCTGKTISNSVPFGMDFAECKSGKFDANVTCF